MSVPFTQAQSKGATSESSGATTPITWTNNTKSGNTIFVVAGTGSSSFQTVGSITDSQGNTYSKIVSNTNTIDGELWFSKNINGGTTPTVTITWSGTGQAISALVVEYNGLNASPADRNASSTGNSTTIASGTTGATNQSTELIIVFGVLQNNSTAPAFVLGAGFGNLATQGTNATTLSTALEDKTVTSSGTQSGTITCLSGLWVGGIATLMTGNTVNSLRLRPHIFSPGLAR